MLTWTMPGLSSSFVALGFIQLAPPSFENSSRYFAALGSFAVN